jgi:hypothetical protein
MISMRHLYKAALAGILISGIPVGASAQMADYFRKIPAALVPTLSENNRLDMLDFMASKMKAEVKNRLGGTSEMTSLTDSTLTIRMSNALQVDMLLLKTTAATEADADREVICLIETFGCDSLSQESTVRFFTPSWQLLKEPPQLSVSDQNTISLKKVQTILKRDDEILKKN